MILSLLWQLLSGVELQAFAAAFLGYSFTKEHVPFHLRNVQNKAGDNKKIVIHLQL